jgi:hypothetical protein
MEAVFENATSFNQKLSWWDLWAVEEMEACLMVPHPFTKMFPPDGMAGKQRNSK